MEFLSDFAPLAARYDGFIIDLWGVLHDGVTPLPGAVDCLTRLSEAGKRIVLLSNAPRRSAPAQAAMRAIGIPDGLYHELLTSGEATYRALRDRADPWFAALGKRVFHLGPERDRNVMEGLDLIPVSIAADAEFLLNTGPDDARENLTLMDFEHTLADCQRHGLPMICANPDLEVIRGGRRLICAGTLGVRYAELGGDVRSVGKPDPAIYGPVLTALGTPKSRTLAVGDSLRTDIAGAKSAGIDACWVLGGLHEETVAGCPDRAREQASLAGLTPAAGIPAFIW